MDSPVSAFAIYSANKKQNKDKKQKKKSKKAVPFLKKSGTSHTCIDPHRCLECYEGPQHLNDDSFMKKVAKKIKQKTRKTKENKNILKKKTLKNKKSKEIPKNNRNKKNISTARVESLDENNSDENIPALIPISSLSEDNYVQDNSSDDACSHSSGEEFTPVETDSAEEGLKVFKWMIAPFNPDEFLNRIWEKKPLHICRNKSEYYKEIISTPIIDDMLRNENIQFTKNIDITSYVDGKRETHNPEGRALPHLVWDFYLNGCSIRLLNPQTYIPKLHLLNATLQEFFNSFVGANAYLTPPDSQGFAPHYDDIEAFILQIEGKKHWRIYKPSNENEVLPRFSSKNFSEDEIGEPLMEVTLEAGHMLYFPRGYIHQGVTIDGEHSLHITVSMYQKHSWADLFEKLLPVALQKAVSEHVELRCGLPFDLYENFGVVNSDINTPRREQIEEMIRSLFDKIKDHLPIDNAVDQMAKNYQHDALPPVLTDLEKAVTVYGDTDVMIENGKVTNRIEIGLDTRIRLLRKNILRMVSEEECIRLYYYAENSLEYHANPPPFLEIEESFAPAIETLITSYPGYVSVENLDMPNESDKLQIADALWGRGLIMTEYPLPNIDDD